MLLCRTLKGIDIYGYQLGVTYQGDKAYKTLFGGILSLATIVLVMINTGNILTDFITFSEQKEVYHEVSLDPKEL